MPGLPPRRCRALLAFSVALTPAAARAQLVTATGATTARTPAAMAADRINVVDYGAVPDMSALASARYSIRAGGETLAADSDVFGPAMVGKTIVVPGAGAGGAGLVSRIAGVDDARHARLATAAGTRLDGVAGSVEVGTDDTAAINRAIAAAEHRMGIANYNVGSVYFPNGMYMVRTVNLTGFGYSSLKITGQGMLWGVNAGQPVVDALGSAWLRWSGVGILGDRYAMPSVGLQIGRLGNASVNSSDNNSFSDFLISGSYAIAAMLDEQSETSQFSKIHFYNNNATGYAVAMDGYHHFPATSPYVANGEPRDRPESFNESLFLDCIFGAHVPLWIGNTSRMTIVTGYAVTGSAYGVMLYEEPDGTTLQPNFDLHIEMPNGVKMTDAFLITGTNPTPFFEGLRWRDHGDMATNSGFKVDGASSVRAVSMPNVDIDVRNFPNGAKKMFDSPTPWSFVSGRVYVDTGVSLGLDPRSFRGVLSTPSSYTDFATLGGSSFRAALGLQGITTSDAVSRVAIDVGGNYYMNGTAYTPTVAFAAPPAGGTPATGHVGALYVAGEGSLGHAGSGYRVAGHVPVEDAGGDTAFTIDIRAVGARGAITAISLNNDGALVRSIPATLSIVQPGGTGGTMAGTNFGIARVAIDDAGAGYAGVPGVTFSTAHAAPAASGTAVPANLDIVTTTRLAATPVTTRPGRYTFAASDCGTTVEYTGRANTTWTVPSGLGTGCAIDVVQKSAGRVTFVGGAGVTAAEFVASGRKAYATGGEAAEARVLVDSGSTFLLTGQVN